jgi:hypothetical protein
MGAIVHSGDQCRTFNRYVAFLIRPNEKLCARPVATRVHVAECRGHFLDAENASPWGCDRDGDFCKGLDGASTLC